MTPLNEMAGKSLRFRNSFLILVNYLAILLGPFNILKNSESLILKSGKLLTTALVLNIVVIILDKSVTN
jgi:hypothetical protein